MLLDGHPREHPVADDQCEDEHSKIKDQNTEDQTKIKDQKSKFKDQRSLTRSAHERANRSNDQLNSGRAAHLVLPDRLAG